MKFSTFAIAMTAPAMLLACANIDEAAPVASTASAFDALGAGADRIKHDVAWLADDAREGREAGTPGYDAAADYVMAQMKMIGLTPGNDGAWFQDVWLRGAASLPQASEFSIITQDDETIVLTSLDDFVLFPSVEQTEFDITAPAVFTGFGVYAPDAGHNDYEGLDLAGKIVVRFGGAPDFFNSEERAHYGSSATKAKFLAQSGAIGVIALYTKAFEERAPWERVTKNPIKKTTTWVSPDGAADVSGPGIKGIGAINPASSELLFDGAQSSFAEMRAQADAVGGAPKGFDLAVSITLKGKSTMEDFDSPNVVGVIEGADPVLKNQVLVITAHLDHIGVDDEAGSDGKDRVNNGAMDNALGIAMLLETARRFKAGEPPARTVVFLALTAEEKGLLGADYFAHYPTLGDKEIVANVNLDMPLMLHSFTDVVAFGAERSSLGGLVKKVLKDAGLALADDPFPGLGIFTRSDHYRFVEQGIASIYLFPGFANGGEEVINGFMADHYHKPSDDLSLPIRYDDAARFADVNYRIAREIADTPDRPTWNEGDFFGDLFAGGK